MAKPTVVVPEVGATAACPCPGTTLFPYPPPRAGIVTAAVRRKCLQVDLGAAAGLLGAGAWGVESMRASSPTHAKAAAALVDDDHRAAWMVRHPSALDKFDQIVGGVARASGSSCSSTYDGTLSPIVNDPDAAFMSETMRMAVRSVAKHFPTAIVSGRCRDKVFEFVKLAELYYAGSHGMDIKGPAKASSRHAKANKVHDRLVELTRSVPGAKVENNKFCVSVHFRCVDEKMWGELAETVKGVMREYPKLRLTQGRMVFEVRPTIKWDKGKALEFLLESLGFADCNNVLPVYIGDDRTDEDAFKVLRRRGQGVGILVSKHPKETTASYSLQEPAEVMEFLLRLVEWKRLSRASLRMQQ
ncbi:hypothetical protein PR202_ga16012 [Eleusine coracana subsp. coracana]|uniref:Trehalose 6-phosphate phosphatase n=1 Tax=Eleusine coracana subsp. coracana TaxID=191504 RepID=A0AAV5CKX1_ELECO|nr:hypothetical protein PR202_ga16012 [Eleusine coracana subsp. coracana]